MGHGQSYLLLLWLVTPNCPQVWMRAWIVVSICLYKWWTGDLSRVPPSPSVSWDWLQPPRYPAKNKQLQIMNEWMNERTNKQVQREQQNYRIAYAMILNYSEVRVEPSSLVLKWSHTAQTQWSKWIKRPHFFKRCYCQSAHGPRVFNTSGNQEEIVFKTF